MAEKMSMQEKKHTLSIGTRTHATISGVCKVESFDEGTVELQTDCGQLTVEGEGMHVGTLDIERGIVELDGQINGVYYSNATSPKKGFRARIFG